MIAGKIDVLKFDKTKFFKGTKGIYADIVLIDTPTGQYGDYVIVQGVSKEDRAAGVKGAILGNAKIFAKKESAPPRAAPRPTPPPRQQAKREDYDPEVGF